MHLLRCVAGVRKELYRLKPIPFLLLPQPTLCVNSFAFFFLLLISSGLSELPFLSFSPIIMVQWKKWWFLKGNYYWRYTQFSLPRLPADHPWISHSRWSTWCVAPLARAKAAWHESCCKNISQHKAFVRCLSGETRWRWECCHGRIPGVEMGGLRGTEASLIFRQTSGPSHVVKWFSSWVRFVFLFFWKKTCTRFNAHCTLHIFFRLSLFVFLWGAKSNLSCCSLALQLRVERFTSRCTWVFSLKFLLLEVFDKKQKHPGTHKSKSPRVIRRFFLRFFFRKSRKSKNLFYTKKSQKRATSLLFNLCIYSHTSLQKTPTKKKQKTFRFFAKTGWSLDSTFLAAVGAVAVDRCCLFSHLSSLHLFHGWLFHRDRWGWRWFKGCVWSPKENCWFSNIT